MEETQQNLTKITTKSNHPQSNPIQPNQPQSNPTETT